MAATIHPVAPSWPETVPAWFRTAARQIEERRAALRGDPAGLRAAAVVWRGQAVALEPVRDDVAAGLKLLQEEWEGVPAETALARASGLKDQLDADILSLQTGAQGLDLAADSQDRWSIAADVVVRNYLASAELLHRSVTTAYPSNPAAVAVLLVRKGAELRDQTLTELGSCIKRYGEELAALRGQFVRPLEPPWQRSPEQEQVLEAVRNGDVRELGTLPAAELNSFVDFLTMSDLARIDSELTKLRHRERLAFASEVLPRLDQENIERLGDAVSSLRPAIDIGPSGVEYGEAAVGIHPDKATVGDIRQGNVGDCWFLASLMSELRADPDFVRRQMVDNGNGTYTVTFYRDGVPVPVTVDDRLPVDPDGNLVFAGNGWVAIYEKAYAQFHSGSYRAIDMDFATAAFEDLTGQDATGHWALPLKGPLPLENLDEALDNDQRITVATKGDRFLGLVGNDDQRILDGRLVSRHVYSVVSVNDTQGTITLRNPFGRDSNTPYEVTITEAEYRKWIYLVTIR